MSSLARELEQQNNQQKSQNVHLPKKAKAKKMGITPGEKLLSIVFAGMVFFGAVQMISGQAKVYQVNKDIQEVQASIKNQQKVNSDLKVQVSELSTYERIWTKAKKMGLVLNENNVKVVQEK
jgi:cell division protein FtsL